MGRLVGRLVAPRPPPPTPSRQPGEPEPAPANIAWVSAGAGKPYIPVSTAQVKPVSEGASQEELQQVVKEAEKEAQRVAEVTDRQELQQQILEYEMARRGVAYGEAPAGPPTMDAAPRREPTTFVKMPGGEIVEMSPWQSQQLVREGYQIQTVIPTGSETVLTVEQYNQAQQNYLMVQYRAGHPQVERRLTTQGYKYSVKETPQTPTTITEIQEFQRERPREAFQRYVRERARPTTPATWTGGREFIWEPEQRVTGTYVPTEPRYILKAETGKLGTPLIPKGESEYFGAFPSVTKQIHVPGFDGTAKFGIMPAGYSLQQYPLSGVPPVPESAVNIPEVLSRPLFAPGSPAQAIYDIVFGPVEPLMRGAAGLAVGGAELVVYTPLFAYQLAEAGISDIVSPRPYARSRTMSLVLGIPMAMTATTVEGAKAYGPEFALGRVLGWGIAGPRAIGKSTAMLKKMTTGAPKPAIDVFQEAGWKLGKVRKTRYPQRGYVAEFEVYAGGPIQPTSIWGKRSILRPKVPSFTASELRMFELFAEFSDPGVPIPTGKAMPFATHGPLRGEVFLPGIRETKITSEFVRDIVTGKRIQPGARVKMAGAIDVMVKPAKGKTILGRYRSPEFARRPIEGVMDVTKLLRPPSEKVRRSLITRENLVGVQFSKEMGSMIESVGYARTPKTRVTTIARGPKFKGDILGLEPPEPTLGAEISAVDIISKIKYEKGHMIGYDAYATGAVEGAWPIVGEYRPSALKVTGEVYVPTKPIITPAPRWLGKEAPALPVEARGKATGLSYILDLGREPYFVEGEYVIGSGRFPEITKAEVYGRMKSVKLAGGKDWQTSLGFGEAGVSGAPAKDVFSVSYSKRFKEGVMFKQLSGDVKTTTRTMTLGVIPEKVGIAKPVVRPRYGEYLPKGLVERVPKPTAKIVKELYGEAKKPKPEPPSVLAGMEEISSEWYSWLMREEPIKPKVGEVAQKRLVRKVDEGGKQIQLQAQLQANQLQVQAQLKAKQLQVTKQLEEAVSAGLSAIDYRRLFIEGKPLGVYAPEGLLWKWGVEEKEKVKKPPRPEQEFEYVDIYGKKRVYAPPKDEYGLLGVDSKVGVGIKTGLEQDAAGLRYMGEPDTEARLKVLQREKPRYGETADTKARLRALQKEKVGVSEQVITKLRQEEGLLRKVRPQVLLREKTAQRMKQRQLTKLVTQVSIVRPTSLMYIEIPYTPPPPERPVTGAPFFWKRKRKKKKEERRKQKKIMRTFQYQPSVTAIIKGTYGKRPKRITGLEARPILGKPPKQSRGQRRNFNALWKKA